MHCQAYDEPILPKKIKRRVFVVAGSVHKQPTKSKLCWKTRRKHQHRKKPQ